MVHTINFARMLSSVVVSILAHTAATQGGQVLWNSPHYFAVRFNNGSRVCSEVGYSLYGKRNPSKQEFEALL